MSITDLGSRETTDTTTAADAPFVSSTSNFDRLREVDPEIYDTTVREVSRMPDS